jgi:hypothetical protein
MSKVAPCKPSDDVGSQPMRGPSPQRSEQDSDASGDAGDTPSGFLRRMSWTGGFRARTAAQVEPKTVGLGSLSRGSLERFEKKQAKQQLDFEPDTDSEFPPGSTLMYTSAYRNRRFSETSMLGDNLPDTLHDLKGLSGMEELPGARRTSESLQTLDTSQMEDEHEGRQSGRAWGGRLSVFGRTSAPLSAAHAHHRQSMVAQLVHGRRTREAADARHEDLVARLRVRAATKARNFVIVDEVKKEKKKIPDSGASDDGASTGRDDSQSVAGTEASHARHGESGGVSIISSSWAPTPSQAGSDTSNAWGENLREKLGICGKVCRSRALCQARFTVDQLTLPAIVAYLPAYAGCAPFLVKLVHLLFA